MHFEKRRKPGRLHAVFLGPESSFHNRHRLWLYLGFLAVVGALVGFLFWKGA
jgi:hypothetical protein